MDDNLLRKTVEQMIVDSVHNGPFAPTTGFMVTKWAPPAPSTIVDASTGLAAMLGYRIEDLIGVSIWDITPECFYADYDWALERFTDGYVEYFKCFKSRDGGLVPVKLHIATVDVAFGQSNPARVDSPLKMTAWGASIAWIERLSNLPYRNPPVQPYERRGGKIIPFTPQLKQ